MINIARYVEDEITISVLLTERCNFRCAHCMYSCGPAKSAAYMSNETLGKVVDRIADLTDIGARVSLNLIGGEPTLDTREFARCLDYLLRRDLEDITYQMTTNGWWLTTVEDTREFMRVIRPAVTQWDERLSVRISDDDFHDEFRPRHLSNGNLRTRLDEVWEGGDPDFSVFYEEDTYCPVCADTFSGYHCSCPECDSEDVELVRREVGPMVPPLPDGDMPWIYVESRWKAVEGSSGVIPVGRGKYVGHNDVGSTNPGACSSPGLTFNVRGDLTDICCKGSRCGLGTVDDHPLVLLELAQQYITEVRPSCYNCREQFAAWNKSRLARRKAKVYSELDSSIRKYKESVDAN